MKKRIQPPKARKMPVEIVMHGDKRVDNYAWLKDKSNPKVIEYLKKENEYARVVMKPAKTLWQKLYDEILSRIKENDESVPYKWGDYLYYNKKEKGKNYLKYYRKRADNQRGGKLVLDVNKVAQGLRYCNVEILPSPDNKILSYMVDSKGDFCFTVYFKNLVTGKHYRDNLKCAYVGAWSNDSKSVYYVKYEKGNRGKQVFMHRLGKRQEDDKLIYYEKDDRFWARVYKTNSKKYIIVHSSCFTSSEVYYLDADSTSAQPQPIKEREDNVLYNVEHNGDDFYIYTNFDALNYRIMTAPVSEPSKKNWAELVPEKKNIKIEGFFIFKNFLVIAERDFGLRKIKILNLKNGSHHYVSFPETVYSVDLWDNFEFDTKYVRFLYTSLTSPVSYYDHDMKKHESILLKQTEVLGGYDKEKYVTERTFAGSSDGKKIPISLVYKKGLKKDGTNPMHLYAYGSYGRSMEVYFSSMRLSLLDKGFIFAIAHIRGGGELGEDWYNEGKLMNKKNTFNDFITCTEYLINKKYTYRGGVAAQGGSAGGTLMGAVVNMRPGLFKCIVANVPAMDLLNSLMDADVDNSKVHFDELGNPDIRQHYFYLKSYDPYENIKSQVYPDMLITTGLNDANVVFWEPAKYTAKLREYKKGGSVLILKTDMTSAHFGPSGRYNQFKEIAYQFAFILKSFGMTS